MQPDQRVAMTVTGGRPRAADFQSNRVAFRADPYSGSVVEVALPLPGAAPQASAPLKRR